MSPRERRAAVAVAAVLAEVLLTALTAAGCGIDPQARVESQATTRVEDDTGADAGRDTAKGARTPTVTPTVTWTASARPSDIDGIAVLRDDPGVRAEVISAIPRCLEGRYPVYTEKISLRGGTGDIRLLSATIYACPGRSCGFEGTRGTYVYRLTRGGPGKRVYARQGAGSRVEVHDGALVLVRPDYRPGDAASCPTGTRTTPLRWTGDALVLAGA